MKKMFFLGIVLLTILFVVSSPGFTKTGGGTQNITAQNTVMSKTPELLGGVEGGHWNVADLVDCGMTSIRLYCDMSRIEPTDDDGVYGSPTIAQIQANPNIIPWSVWDARMNDASLWGTGVSLAQILADCAANGIQPLICIRNKDIHALPAWAPSPPFDATNPAGVNEMWEFCFALAYWCNVRNNYGFYSFQSLNEPDRVSQGWTGTQAQYVDYVKLQHDAVTYANNLASPVVPVWNNIGNSPSWGFIDIIAANADDYGDVHDYHNYRRTELTAAEDAAQRDVSYGTNAIREPLWDSEYGTYTSTYDGAMGMTIANTLYDVTTCEYALAYPAHMRGMSIFVMWDWGTYDGLVDPAGNKSTTFYAHRIMDRAVNGGKDRMTITGATGKVMVTRSATKVYVVAVNNAAVFNVNLSALGVPNGTATVYNYTATVNDVVVANPTVSNGLVSFTGLTSGVALLVVNR